MISCLSCHHRKVRTTLKCPMLGTTLFYRDLGPSLENRKGKSTMLTTWSTLQVRPTMRLNCRPRTSMDGVKDRIYWSFLPTRNLSPVKRLSGFLWMDWINPKILLIFYSQIQRSLPVTIIPLARTSAPIPPSTLLIDKSRAKSPEAKNQRQPRASLELGELILQFMSANQQSTIWQSEWSSTLPPLSAAPPTTSFSHWLIGTSTKVCLCEI